MVTACSGAVCLCLAKSDEAEATVEYLLAADGDIRVSDHDTFYRLDATARIDVDLDAVGEILGQALPLGQFLVIMTSFVGRVDIDDRRFSVSGDAIQPGDGGAA